MFKNYKIIAVTPAGRKRYLEILLPYIFKNREIIDEYHLWLNTTNKSDINYMEGLAEKNPDFIKLISINIQPSGNNTIRFFFQNCIDKNTIYIRIDDDICFIEENAIKELLNFRINNQDYFIVYANIINNSICSYINQRKGNLGFSQGNVTYDVFCEKGWKNGEFASFIHSKFIEDYSKGLLKNYQYDYWILCEFERVSINFITWFGHEFAEFNGMVDGEDEEQWLSVDKPKRINKYNCICGSAIVSHFSYFTQREYLESKTDILQKYKLISEEVLSLINPNETLKKESKIEENDNTKKTVPSRLDKLYIPAIQTIEISESRPFWSIMIPTYNCANYLVETLKSVLAQDPGLEQMQIEVVDDCSIKDDPEAVVRELGQGRVSFFRQAQNVGLTTNFNTCIQRAKGEWVHILHGDDAVLPGFYSQMQQSIESEPNIGAAFCRCIFIDENNNWKHLSPLYRETAGIFPEFWKALAITNRITTPSIIVKRSVYEKLGGFNSQLRHTADWEMWTRIGVHYQLLFEPLPLAFYREHSASDTSRLVTTGANIIDTLSCINIFEHYLPSVLATELTNKAKEVIVIQALDKATVLFSKGDIQAAINQIREGLKCSTSSMVLRSFANFLVNNEPLFKLFVEMIVSSKDDILSSLTSPYQIDEYEEKLEVDLRDINLIIFPDWQLPEELVYENLKSIIEAVIKLSNQLNIALLIDSSNGSEEEINLMISDIIFQMFQENELDSTGEPTISFVNNLSDRKWRVLLNKLKARIVLKYQNNEAISKSGADQILSLNLKELKNILG